MNMRFLIPSAAILAAAILSLAVADNARPWRRLQADFFELHRQQLRARIAELDDRDAATVEALRANIAAEEDRLAGRRDEIRQLQEDLRQFRGKVRAAELRRDKARSELAAARWRLETSPEDAASEGDSEALQEDLRLTRMEIESFGELIADREDKLDAVRAELFAAEERWNEAKEPIEDLKRQLADLGSTRAFAGSWSSEIAVRQITVDDFPVFLPGARSAERIDRCATCHLGIGEATAASDDGPTVFASHPRQDLFVAAASPHPSERFGCTVCHRGQGRATDFSRAGHTPRTAEQAAAWESTWGWHRDEQLEPMLPLQLTEATCGRCHAASLVEAPTLQRGRRLIAKLGCMGCHSADRIADDLQQSGSGPSLLGIDGKTRPAWVYRWLESPRDFRPSTAMPHVLDSEPEDSAARDRLSAEIGSIVHYLWEHSRSAAYEPSTSGDAEAGRRLFGSVGCAACHRVEPEAAAKPGSESLRGPTLARIGSKVTSGWLQTWLLDPQIVRPGTPMPSLRLDEQEAADLTAYLMTRRDSRWEETQLPSVPVDVRDALVLSHLEREHTIEASQAHLERMSDRERNTYLGERTIARRGCHGCHQIPGFVGSSPLGPSWNELSPRLRGWSPETHAPSYRLSEAETDAVTVAILGWPGRSFSAGHSSTSKRTAALESGRRVIEHYGCRGCHRIEGRGGDLAEIPGTEQAPPDLTHAGARLRAPWLFSYLMDPGSVSLRPWLTTRMPSFALSATEGNALVRYFAVLADRELMAKGAVRSPSAGSPTEADLAVGQVVYEMLQCSACHRGGGGHLSLPEVAPSYQRSSQRLRPDWVVDWILDPHKWQPETRMPATFLADGETEPDSSFLIGSISTPIFTVERQRLLRLFDSEKDLHAYLADPVRVAEALRDYLWTLED